MNSVLFTRWVYRLYLNDWGLRIFNSKHIQILQSEGSRVDCKIYDSNIIQLPGVSKNLLESGAHKASFWIHLLDVQVDVQGVGIYLFIDFMFLIVWDFHSLVEKSLLYMYCLKS